MDTLTALVPMKAHSERVPNKNTRSFNGRPLFHWILTTLRQATVVDEIVVNTDSDRIASTARTEFGATVHERPERLRGDEVSMNRIIGYDIERTDADWYLQTHCTNPLLSPRTVEDAYETFRESDAPSLFGVTAHNKFFWTVDGEPINHRNDESLTMTQRLTPVYEENSNIYLFSASSYATNDNRIGPDAEPYEIDEVEATDIDEPTDFRLAEFFHRERFGDEPTDAEVAAVFEASGDDTGA